MTDTSQRDHDREDLVNALVELRAAIAPLIKDLLCGVRLSGESVERWLAFVDGMSSVISLCRRDVLQPGVVDEAASALPDRWPSP